MRSLHIISSQKIDARRQWHINTSLSSVVPVYSYKDTFSLFAYERSNILMTSFLKMPFSDVVPRMALIRRVSCVKSDNINYPVVANVPESYDRLRPLTTAAVAQFMRSIITYIPHLHIDGLVQEST